MCPIRQWSNIHGNTVKSTDLMRSVPPHPSVASVDITPDTLYNLTDLHPSADPSLCCSLPNLSPKTFTFGQTFMAILSKAPIQHHAFPYTQAPVHHARHVIQFDTTGASRLDAHAAILCPRRQNMYLYWYRSMMV